MCDQVADVELETRLMLHDAGFRWLPCFPNSKAFRKDVDIARPWAKVPTGNAQMLFPPGYIAVDVDSQAALELYSHVVDALPPTLEISCRRGPKAFYLTHGAKQLQGAAEFLRPGLELLTDRCVAPGSIVENVYYATTALRPIAQLTEVETDWFADIVGVATVPPGNRGTHYSFVVEDVDHYGPAKRHERLTADRHCVASPSTLNYGLLQETRVGSRGWAMWVFALQSARAARSFEEYEADVLSAPVGKKAREKGPRWLRAMVWDKAAAIVAATASRAPSMPWTPAVSRLKYGDEGRARMWADHWTGEVAQRPPSGERDRLLQLVQQHASWIAVFGVDHKLSQRQMLAHMNMASKKHVGKLHRILEGLEAVRKGERPTGDDSQQWIPMIDSQDLEEFPVPRISVSPPSSDLRLLSDEEVQSVLRRAREVEEVSRAKSWRLRVDKASRDAVPDARPKPSGAQPD